MTITLFIHFVNTYHMDNLDTKELKIIFSALDNEKRLKIIELCSEKSHTVTELSKKIGLDYSITVEYISKLEKANLVRKNRNEDRTVSITSLIKINNLGEIKKI